jgi:thiol-disulfide isomerase/thioredoxin
MKFTKKLIGAVQVTSAVTAVLIASGCGREARPGSERKSQAAAAAAEASSTPPSDSVAPEAPEPPSDATTAAAPDAELTPLTGPQLLNRIAASGRRATLVNAWASWCGPCRRELPMLQALAINWKPQGVAVVLVSVDEPKDAPKARSFLKDNGITLPTYIVEGSVADFKTAIHPGWPGMLPASFLFDRSARLVHFWGGEAFENELTPIIEDFLAGRAIPPETRYGLAPGKVEP